MRLRQKSIWKNKFVIISISLLLMIITYFSIKGIQTKITEADIISAIFLEELTPMELVEVLNENKLKSKLFVENDFYDRDFKLALFYSNLSVKILILSKQKKNLVKYNGPLYKKTLDKWNQLIKKDREIYYFKTNYIETYRKIYYSQN